MRRGRLQPDSILPTKAIEGFRRQRHDARLVIIAQVRPHTRQVLNQRDIVPLQLLGRSYTAQFQNLRGVESAARNDDLAHRIHETARGIPPSSSRIMARIGAVRAGAHHVLDGHGGGGLRRDQRVEDDAGQERVELHRQRVAVVAGVERLADVVGGGAAAAVGRHVGEEAEDPRRLVAVRVHGVVVVAAHELAQIGVRRVSGRSADGARHGPQERRPVGRGADPIRVPFTAAVEPPAEAVALRAVRRVMAVLDVLEDAAHLFGAPRRVARDVGDVVPVVVARQVEARRIVHCNI